MATSKFVEIGILDEICDVLNTVKIVTGSADKSNWVRQTDGSKKISFPIWDYLFTDQHYGFNPFFGCELILEKDQPAWTLHYYGFCHNSLTGQLLGEFQSRKIYRFLKLVLGRPDRSIPVRGISRLDGQGEFEGLTYRNNLLGNLNRFIGHEKIFSGGLEVYHCDYFGGML
jgi:hypothetical protein